MTATAYRRQAPAYREWLLARAAGHADAFADLVGAEAAVTAWRRHYDRRRVKGDRHSSALRNTFNRMLGCLRERRTYDEFATVPPSDNQPRPRVLPPDTVDAA
ncbi:hypothetical protein [Streptosporangium sp. NPDC002524]|uniref:hypothetical protein n=1 Tax=Streptosporangium sp. NPDC002524 TaxID=3154537 RepID=UPI0033232691